ncbi:MAG: prephenate dehydratase domain-containing protein [Candidatus Dasytiphilus stammeri]
MHLPRVAFLGPRGSYSHIAANKYAARYFKKFLEMSFFNFAPIFHKVETRQADYAVVPIENSTAGSIKEIYDLLQHTHLFIVGELILPIEHCMLVSTKACLENLEKIYSHPQSFQQCSNFISKFSQWNIEYTVSTAAAMEKVAAIKSSKIAALGSEDGSKYYHLKILARNICNQQRNSTRFIILSRKRREVATHIPAKTTLIISTQQPLNFLVEILMILRQYNIILSHVESWQRLNPTGENMFYLDVKGNLHSSEMQQALRIMKKKLNTLKILGCYPSDHYHPTMVNLNSPILLANSY